MHDDARSPIYRHDIRYPRAAIADITPGRWKETSAYPWYVGDIAIGNPRLARIIGLEDGLPYDVEIHVADAVCPGRGAGLPAR